MKTINIQGKEYITVNERLKEFHRLYPNGAIQIKIIKYEGDEIVMQAIVCPDVDKPNRSFGGHAREVAGANYINKKSYVENCETSAVGRALGMLGIGIDTSVASADEVINNQNLHEAIKKNVGEKPDDEIPW